MTRTCPTGKSCPNDTPVYDNEGRQTSGNGRTQVTYTAFDLPRTIVKGGVTTTYKYDAFGQRVKESTPSATTFTVPGIFEKRTAGTATTYISHLRGTDGPIGQAVTKGATTEIQYQLTDALGSSSATVTAAGTSPAAVTQSYYYDPYGVRTNSDGSPFTGTTSDTTRGFTYHEHDDDLGLINMNGRIFDPTQAGFLTPDPIIANPYSGQDWNPYTYVRNTPLNYTDPTGYQISQGGRISTCIRAGDSGCHAAGDTQGGGNGAPDGNRWPWYYYSPTNGNAAGHANKTADASDSSGMKPGANDKDGTPTSTDCDPGGVNCTDEKGNPVAGSDLVCLLNCLAGVPSPIVDGRYYLDGSEELVNMGESNDPFYDTVCVVDGPCYPVMTKSTILRGLARLIGITSGVTRLKGPSVTAGAKPAADTAAITVRTVKPVLSAFENNVYNEAAKVAGQAGNFHKDSLAVATALKNLNPAFDTQKIGEYGGQMIIGSLKSRSGIVSVDGVIQIVKQGANGAYHVIRPLH
ncbi:RHS repeat-associated core domain-containing protein [Streptomyces sp. NBC_00233]|uniref:RHS repeat-associated core domain-containing protein n=1 Tax=Streptomyces sp. NBC_00233 TaxID=2975686 RepID=UPI00224EAA8C|nr:RHS repeat-associated core domain-containing protein [Streptomyces sp. NBC_00233]MCX5233128.1 RHS repeat-associated core domain-containing protein [Streptomyces sp. NBC_00233]